MQSLTMAGAVSGGDGANDVVHRLRDLGDASDVFDAPLLNAGDLRRVPLHGVETAVKGLETLQPAIAAGPLIADDGDDARIEEALQPLQKLRHGDQLRDDG